MSRLLWFRGVALAAAVTAAVVAPPARAEIDFNDPSCPGVQPGAAMLPAVNPQYASTWGFLFSDGHGGVYTFVDATTLSTIPTASVQVNPTPTDVERTWRRGAGPGVSDGMRKLAGHAVWYRWYQSETAFPRALVQVDAGRHFRGAVCSLGEPRAIDLSITDLPEPATAYGQGSRVDFGTGVRQDVLPYGAYSSDAVCLARPHLNGGDGNAPVMTGDNLAFGLVAGVEELGPDWIHRGCGDPVFRFGPMIEQANRALHIRLTLIRYGSGIAR